MKPFFLILASSFLIANFSHAASGDSVMSPNGVLHQPSKHYQSATASSGNIYSYTSTTQYQTSICPSGLTVNGSAIYNSAQRQIIYTYLGNQLVGNQTTAWSDIDTDCAGTEIQVVACPAGYTGTFTQQRKVGTASNGNGTKQYEAWNTTSNNCVAVRKTGYTYLFASKGNEQEWRSGPVQHGYIDYVAINNQNGLFKCVRKVLWRFDENDVFSIEDADNHQGGSPYDSSFCGETGNEIGINNMAQCEDFCAHGTYDSDYLWYRANIVGRSADNCQITYTEGYTLRTNSRGDDVDTTERVFNKTATVNICS